jgi:hypothetical protein
VYKGQVELNFVKVFDSKSEDAVNIVSSNFHIDELHIDGAFSDGLDIDFGIGDIVRSTIQNTGNDALDFSGSTIHIADVKCMGYNDKGVSVGEYSNVDINGLYLENGRYGLVSKDLSVVKAENVELRSLDVGALIYRKKPEFGPAQIEINEFDSEDVDIMMVLGKESVLKWKQYVFLGAVDLQARDFFK